MVLKGEKGFTLVEIIVVAAIIAILAGILVPMIFSQIDDARLARARGDLKSLSTAIFAMRKDVGQWPACANTTILFGRTNFDQAALTALGYDVTVPQLFEDHLMTDDNGCYGAMYKGPYFGSVEGDPWGNAYIANAQGFGVDQQPVLLISAGPDGVYQTGPAAGSAAGDDIAMRIK